MINEKQMRAARALLNWSRDDLARECGVPAPTIKRMEIVGPRRSAHETVVAVQAALEAAGIEFIEENGKGAGVRFSLPSRMNESQANLGDA
jgi:transcriptional regulator with XRE-family HTH domain